ncbi:MULTISPECIES: hypothetical protein [Streptomyces rochei group]|uniref:Uncharacterized protein n=1 Tax=Streptomyces plicatus TaxID=1922 RepID=A0ABW1XUQ5_STRPL|nr:hypothetical protein [Streptomyces plicatus]GGZ40156.1 hypothetical protein GCM10010301_09850 [Streptomyces plicatus]
MGKHYAVGTWVQEPGEKGMTVSVIRNISEAEYERYKTIVGKFAAIQERKTFQFLERSSGELKSTFSVYVNIENVGGSFRTINWRQAGGFLMERFATWLAATRLYLESERDFMMSRFGEESSQYQSLKESTSTAFDTREGYRFLYNLRDYTQHCGIPSSGVTVSTNSKKERITRLHLNRTELLSARFKWNRHAKSLLESWPEKIEIIPLMDDAMAGYMDVERCILRILIDDCATVISEIRGEEYEALKDGEHLAAFQIPTGANGGSFNLQSFPTLQALTVIEEAARSDDPVSRIFSQSVQPPILTPEALQADQRAKAVLSAFINPQEPDQVGKLINGIISADGDITPLISGLVNASAQLTYALSMFLGVSPLSLLGVPLADAE